MNIHVFLLVFKVKILYTIYNIVEKEVVRIDTKQKIEAACKIAGVTVTELGKRIGMSQQTISYRLKTGKFKQSELEEMAVIMGAQYHSIFTFPDGNKVE